MDNVLWKIKDDEELKYTNHISNFYVFENYLWTTNGVDVILHNLDEGSEWEIPIHEVRTRVKIYDIKCDEDWAWFLTNNGMYFYYWSEKFD